MAARVTGRRGRERTHVGHYLHEEMGMDWQEIRSDLSVCARYVWMLRWPLAFLVAAMLLAR
jgi:hypothetical protein